VPHFKSISGGIEYGAKIEVRLLGVLFEHPEFNAKGEVILQKAGLEFNVPISPHLGYVIKSEKIIDFRDLVILKFKIERVLEELPYGYVKYKVN
jgi:hypothetical protein